MNLEHIEARTVFVKSKDDNEKPLKNGMDLRLDYKSAGILEKERWQRISLKMKAMKKGRRNLPWK